MNDRRGGAKLFGLARIAAGSIKVNVMNQPPGDLTKRLLYILHYGLADIRSLALGAGHEQIADLADALEILPGIIDHWEEDRADLIHFVLRNYQDKYPGRAFDYSAHIERDAPPERF